jgi:enoyl-CoA hydratase
MHRVFRLTSQVAASSAPNEPLVLYDKIGRVAKITLNRPKALNALNSALMKAIAQAVLKAQADVDVGCIVLTGAGRAFAAGADIKQMKDKSYAQMLLNDWIKDLDTLSTVSIPIIAAVNGFAFGGGCELAMLCDIIWASEKAQFGQPEIKIGAIPGAGGTQRLTRAVGKSKSMEMCLAGDPISAEDALKSGLVSKVLPADQLIPEVMKLAAKIAEKSRPLVTLTKEAVLASQETTLTQGVKLERRLFHSVFALKDQKEGMTAFAEKRAPKFSHS